MFGEPILILLRNFICTILLAGQVLAHDAQVIERRELADGLIREKLLLQGWDPTDPVPGIAIYPKGKTKLPFVVLLHWFQGSKEAMEPWAHDLAPRQLFVLIVDLHFHGERTVAGVFAKPNLPSLGDEYAVFIHQASIAHSARDFPFILEGLQKRKEIDLSRLGVAGISMGGSLAMVLASREKRVSAAVSLVGACDFWWDVTKIPPGPQQENKKKEYGQRVQRLVSSIDPWPRLDAMPPTALFVANGRNDPFIDIESMRRFSTKMRGLYASLPDRFAFYEEDVGHEATETMQHQAEEWLVRHLKERALAEKADHIDSP